jgi:hypothetical protein
MLRVLRAGPPEAPAVRAASAARLRRLARRVGALRDLGGCNIFDIHK